MDPELWIQYKKNADTFRQRIDDICEKYANVEDPGFDLCLETMTYKTRKGAVPAESVEAKRKLEFLENFADKNVETLKDVSNTEDSLVTYANEDEEKEDHGHCAPERVMESLPGQFLLEVSQVSSSLLSLPEEQDPELERTFSSQSDTPTLQDLYPSMLTQIHKACQRQQVSEAASSLRRKYQRQRWKGKRLNPGQSFMNSSAVRGSSTTFQTASVAPKGCTEAHIDTSRIRDAGSGQGSSMWKCVTSQGAAEQAPVLVMDFSTPPSSGPSSPSDSTPDLNQTYVVRTSPPLPHNSQCSEQQVRKQQVNKFNSLYPHVGATLASQPVTGLCVVGAHTQVFPSPKRSNYEGSLSSPSKVNSPLKSPSNRHRDRSVLMEYSPPCQEEVLTSSRRFPHTQHGLLEKHYSTTDGGEALRTSPMKCCPKTRCSVQFSPQQHSFKARVWQPEERSSMSGGTMPSSKLCKSSGTVSVGDCSPYKRRFLSGEAPPSSFSNAGGTECDPSSGVMGGCRPYKRRNLHGEAPQSSFSHSAVAERDPTCSVLIGDYSPYKRQFLSREAPEGSPSRVSPRKHSFIHSPHSTAGSMLSSLPHQPEVYTSLSHHHHRQKHHYPRDVQENVRPSPSRLEALLTRRRSFSGPRDAKCGPAQRLSSSIQHVNQQFRQLYHQHICQRSSRLSLSYHSSSCCLCEQSAEGCTPSSSASSVTTTTPANASNSHLAALSLTPVRRRRFQSELSPLLKRLQKRRQVHSSPRHRQETQQQQRRPLYSADACDDTASMISEMSVESRLPDLNQDGQVHSGSRRHHHHPSGSSSTLAALGLAPPQPRLSKRRCLSEPKESPSLKRFRESTQPQHRPSKPHSYPQHQRQQQWEGDDDGDYSGCNKEEEEDMIGPVGNGLSEEHLTRSRALLLQCPSPRFLRAAMRLIKAGRDSRTRLSLGTRPHASARRTQQDQVYEAEGLSQEAWNESGLSPSSRRRLLYGVPRC